MTIRRSTWVAIGIALLLAVGLVAAGMASGSGDESGQVKVACRDWVKDRLKSPASADFSGESVDRDGDRYVVTGSVDSENSFGAAIRNDYRCEATHDGDGSTLVGLTGLDG